MRHEVERQTEMTNRLQREMDHNRREQHTIITSTILTREDLHTDEDENGTADFTNDADQHVPQRELDRITAAEQNVNIKSKLEVRLLFCLVFACCIATGNAFSDHFPISF